MNLTDLVEKEQIKTNIPTFNPGDTLKVHVKVIEGNNERVQIFEGVVIARQGKGVSETFTVRKLSFGVGVERIFPIHSPNIEKIEIKSKGKVRRAKLYYLRDRIGKAAKVKELRYDQSLAAQEKIAAEAEKFEKTEAAPEEAEVESEEVVEEVSADTKTEESAEAVKETKSEEAPKEEQSSEDDADNKE